MKLSLRLILVYLLCSFVVLPAISQVIGISIGGHYQRCGFVKDELNAAVASYNNVLPLYANSTPDKFWVQPMKPYVGNMPLTGRMFSLQARGFGKKDLGGFSWVFGIRTGKSSAATRSSKSVYNSGDEWNLWTKDITVTLSAGTTLGKHFFWNILSTETVFRTTRLHSQTIWGDGSKSSGFEHWYFQEYNGINGMYKAPFIGLDTGTEIGLKFGRILIPARIGYLFPVFSEDQPLNDYTLDARYRQNSFPKNFQLYIDEPMGQSEDINAIGQNQFRGLRMSIGVEFMLFGKLKNTP